MMLGSKKGLDLLTVEQLTPCSTVMGKELKAVKSNDKKHKSYILAIVHVLNSRKATSV